MCVGDAPCYKIKFYLSRQTYKRSWVTGLVARKAELWLTAESCREYEVRSVICFSRSRLAILVSPNEWTISVLIVSFAYAQLTG